MSDRLDHGLLNVPLSKRGDIDALIDCFKAEQARKGRVARAASVKRILEEKKRVRELLKQMDDHRVMALAKPLGSRRAANARDALYREALCNLPLWIRTLEREVAA